MDSGDGVHHSSALLIRRRINIRYYGTRATVYPHTLTIGCTGMLLGASQALAARSRVLTSVAGSERSLGFLDGTLAHGACTHHRLMLDWSAPDVFVAAIAAHVGQFGAPALVLAWLHDDTLGPRLATALAPAHKTCAFFQVCGSTAANPALNAEWVLRAGTIPPTVDYHRIILGFHRDATGPRWLYNSEICAGVLDAIDHPRDVTIVGSVEPWSERP